VRAFRVSQLGPPGSRELPRRMQVRAGVGLKGSDRGAGPEPVVPAGQEPEWCAAADVRAPLRQRLTEAAAGRFLRVVLLLGPPQWIHRQARLRELRRPARERL
jgi:hypothetical protein